MSEENTAPAVAPVTTTENVGTPQRFEIPEEVKPEDSEVTAAPTVTPPEKTFTQADIDRIVQKRLAEEARREERRLAEILKSRQPEMANTTREIGKPVLEKYESYDAWLEALSDWKVSESLKVARQEWQKEAQERSFKQTADNFSQKAESAKAEYPDWDEVALDPSLMITREMTDTILESDLGPQVLYFLGKNPSEAARISKLSPFAQAREIGKLEVKVSTPKPKISSAPAPISPVKGQSTETSLSETDDMKTWIKRRSKQVHG